MIKRTTISFFDRIILRMKISKNQAGAASMITVMILALILTIVVTGLMRLSLADQRGSIDDELTNRAFYAAESGLSDAIRAIKADNVANGADCEPEGVLNAANELIIDQDLDIAVTCQLIDESPGNIEAAIDQNEGLRIPLNYEGTKPTRVILRWHIVGDPADGGDGSSVTPRSQSNLKLPQQNSWGANNPAMIRAHYYSAPSTTSFSRTDLTNKAVWLNPSNIALASVVNMNTDDASIVNGQCQSGGQDATEYACKATIAIGDLDTQEAEIRLTSLYKSSHISLEFENDDAEFIGAQALIDVTGRATDVYRRIQARVDISGDSDRILINGPNGAITSGEDLCKQLQVSTVVTDVSNAACSP